MEDRDAPRGEGPSADADGDTLQQPGVRPGRRGWFRRGRWMVERERFGLPKGEPEPPFCEAEPVRVGMRRILGRLGLESAAVQAILLEEWPTLLGEEIARHTRPGSVRNGELTVFVRGSVWYAELRRHGAATIERRIVERLGERCVRRVVLRPDPEGSRPLR